MAEDLSLAEIFAWLRKRDTSALPETTQVMILEAWHAGRLRLVADKVREFRPAYSVRPQVYVSEPHPGDLQAKQYVEELRKTKIVGYLPVRYLPASAQPTTDVTKELLSDQRIPMGIPCTDIKFHWKAGTAVWWDPATGFVAEFSGIGTTREACNRAWPPPPVQAPKQWAFAKVNFLKGSVIQPGIGRRRLAGVLTPLMEDDHKLGLVTHALAESTIYRSLKEDWGVWPVQ